MFPRMKETLATAAVAFALIAAYFIYSAVTLPTSLEIEGELVANLELMHAQSINMAEGIGAAIVSAIFTVGAAIVGALRPDSSSPDE